MREKIAYDLYGHIFSTGPGIVSLVLLLLSCSPDEAFHWFLQNLRASACEYINRMLSSFVIFLTTTDGIDWINSVWYTCHLYSTLLLELSSRARPQVELSLDKLLFVAFARTLISTQDELIWKCMKLSFQKPATWNHWRTWMNMVELALALSLYFLVCPSHPFGPRALDA